MLFILFNISLIAQGDNSLLIRASQNGDLNEVMELLKSGIDVNDKDDDGVTALMYATDNGYTEIVELLRRASAR